MNDSKSLKNMEFSQFESWWYQTKVAGYLESFLWFFQKPYYQVKKLIEWQINVFRYDYDFDGQCLFSIMEYKLKRISKALANDVAWQDPKDMKALSLAIKLAGRLKDDHYESEGHERHQKLWGVPTDSFTPIEGTTNSRWNIRYPKANTPELKVQMSKDLVIFYQAAERKRQREEKCFYAILHKYLRVWWS